jgi:hypothetical protein
MCLEYRKQGEKMGTTEVEKTVVVVADQSNALGIASFIFGLIGIFILSPLFVPLSFLFGIIGIAKKQLVWSIVGMIFALIGFVTSPILMGSLGLAGIGSAAGL